MIVNLRQIYYISRQNHRKQEGMRMPRRGENIYKRKDGRWEGRYIKEHLNGKAKYGYVSAKLHWKQKKHPNSQKQKVRAFQYLQKNGFSRKNPSGNNPAL